MAMKVYVVTQPESVRGIYESWPACQAAVAGVPGARYQAVPSRERAEAILRGEEVRLPPGAYAFVDGNHLGGVGVVFVKQRADGSAEVREVGTTVYAVFQDAGIPGLETRRAITAAIDRLRNIVAELAALHAALAGTPPGVALTVVHDYEGVGAWMEGRWKTRDPLVTAMVAACRDLIARRRLTVTFRRQRGHTATVVGRDDFATYNARADALAAEAAMNPA
jgi:ribonuclease H-related protein